MTVQDLARRVDKLEWEMAQWSKTERRSGAWYLAHAGQFKNDPVYDEIVSRGQAYRRSLGPTKRTGRAGCSFSILPSSWQRYNNACDAPSDT